MYVIFMYANDTVLIAKSAKSLQNILNAHHKYREDWKFNYQCTIKTWKFNYQYTIKPQKLQFWETENVLMMEKNGNTKVTMLKLWISLIDLLSTQKHKVTNHCPVCIVKMNEL